MALNAASDSASSTGRGALFVFEGLDRSGKTTQAKKLCEHLTKTVKGDVKQIKFPDRDTHTGKIIHEYLTSGLEMNDNAIHLLFSANRWEKRDEMQKLLESGTHLIVDRYVYSGIAYSAAKGNRHLTRAWCSPAEQGLLAPDAVFFLSVDAAAAKGREDYGQERYERLAFQQTVKDEFTALQDGNFHIVDADRDIESIHSDIVALASKIAAACAAGEQPLTELWDRSNLAAH